MQTKNIRLGPGGFLLPYHHPAELANRVAMLDHISGGRLNFGVAASRPAERLGDVQRRRHAGVNRDMTREALDIILKLWSTPSRSTTRASSGREQAGADVRLPQAAHQAAADARIRRSASPASRKAPTR